VCTSDLNHFKRDTFFFIYSTQDIYKSVLLVLVLYNLNKVTQTQKKKLNILIDIMMALTHLQQKWKFVFI
jgi:hypothetical protein